MWKTVVSGLAAASVAQAMAIEKRDPCSIPNSAPVTLVGAAAGKGGAFCETRWPGGDLIRGIHTYSNGNGITAIDLIYTNGDLITRGRGKAAGDAPSGQLDLVPGEVVTGLYLYGNGKGTSLGKMQFTTKRADNSQGGATLGTSKAQENAIDVGGGMIIGATGAQGDRIDKLGLIFYKAPVDHYTIDGFKFDSVNKDGVLEGWPGSSVHTYTAIHAFNGGSTNGTYGVTGNRRLRTSHVYSQSTTGSFGMGFKASVEYSIPEVVKVSAEVSTNWEVKHETGSSIQYQDSSQTGWSLSGQLKPNTGVTCHSLEYISESGKQFYTTDVQVFFTDGSSTKYVERGTIQATSETEVFLECSPSTSKTAPQGYTPVPVLPIGKA